MSHPKQIVFTPNLTIKLSNYVRYLSCQSFYGSIIQIDLKLRIDFLIRSEVADLFTD